MKTIRWLDKHFEEALCVIILIGMVIAVFLQVVLRFATAPLAWTEELARYLFAWLVYISSSYAVRERGHIKVEVVSLLLKERGKLVLEILANICFFFFALVVSVYGWQYIGEMATHRAQYSPTMHINMIYPYMSFAVGFTLMLFRLVQDTYFRVREYREFKATENEMVKGVE